MHKQTPIAHLRPASAVEEDGWQRAPSRSLPGAILSDRSARAKILLQGDNPPALLRRLWDLPDLAPTAGTTIPQGYAYCLRPDRYFLSLPPGAENATISTLTAALRDEDGLLTITDLTHGRAELWLQGPAAAHLLSHLCGLDFHATAFPDLAAQESSVARTHQLILRHDHDEEPAYALVGPRSLGAYLWQTLAGIATDEHS